MCDYFIHLGVFFRFGDFLEIQETWIYVKFGLLGCFKIMPFVPLASTYRKTGTYKIQAE